MIQLFHWKSSLPRNLEFRIYLELKIVILYFDFPVLNAFRGETLVGISIHLYFITPLFKEGSICRSHCGRVRDEGGRREGKRIYFGLKKKKNWVRGKKIKLRESRRKGMRRSLNEYLNVCAFLTLHFPFPLGSFRPTTHTPSLSLITTLATHSTYTLFKLFLSFINQ
jgi:hypothetical protein